ncbi:hypothetical protein GC207_09660 [bacterium]|nr:hypothetical protein [bacterium]
MGNARFLIAGFSCFANGVIDGASFPSCRRRVLRATRRSTLGAVLFTLLIAVVEPLIGFAADQNPARQLIRDNHFRDGFVVWRPEPGKHVRDCVLKGIDPTASPVWGLDQWNSKFPLKPDSSSVGLEGMLVWNNAAKTVTIGRAETKEADVSLAINSFTEYGPHARKAGDPWVHLLVEQEFLSPPPLDGLTSAQLHVEAKLLRSRNLHQRDYSPDVHAAQFQIFFTVQNRNPQSSGHGDLLWFGIPIYDNRERFPKEYKARDFGGTEKYIFTPAAQTFGAQSAHDGDWITIDHDLLPLMVAALKDAWSKGFLSASTNLADYAIGGMNMGWELPGTFDVAMQIRDLSLTVRAK